MYTKQSALIIATFLIIALVLVIQMGVMPAKASQGDAQAMICAVNTRLMHQAMLRRLDFALADGRGNALGLRSGNQFISQDACDINLLRLEYALSDGGKINLGNAKARTNLLEIRNEFNLKRLNYTLSDGRGDAFEPEAEELTRDLDSKGFNPHRLEFTLNDGRKYGP